MEYSTDNAISVNLDSGSSDGVSIFDFCDHVKLVELEEKPEAIVSEEGIQCKAFGDTSLFLMGREDYLIREYDYHGKLLKVANMYGRGPGEFTMANDMIINTYTKTLDILNPMGIINQYSLDDLSWIKTLDFSEKVKSAHFFAAISPTDYILYSLFDEPSLFSYSVLSEKTIPIDIPTPPVWLSSTSFCGGGTPFYYSNGILKYVLKYDGSIYGWDGAEMYIDNQWDFGKRHFVPEMIEPEKDYFYYSELLNRTSRKYATTFNRTVENDRYVFQNFRFKGRLNWKSIIYDKINNTVHVFSKTREGVYLIAGKMSNGRVCCIINPELRDYFVNEELLRDEDSQKTYDMLSDDSNAILIIYTFKNE